MYNLFVSSSKDSWNGKPIILELSRCVREYTDIEITEKYKNLGDTEINELRRFPCIFAYENYREKDPKFGLISDVTKHGEKVRINCKIIELEKFLSHKDLLNFSFELDIAEYEMNRTHWALKNVNLARELNEKGIKLPQGIHRDSKAVDISKHYFDVSFSFPGEVRGFVESIVAEVEREMGPNSYFYDKNYTAQLARPSMDTLLQDIYQNRSKLVVVFLCEKYQEKEWCGVEFRAIREIIKKKKHDNVMFVKMDDGKVDGVFETDGYVNGQTHTPKEIADFIRIRIEILDNPKK